MLAHWRTTARQQRRVCALLKVAVDHSDCTTRRRALHAWHTAAQLAQQQNMSVHQMQEWVHQQAQHSSVAVWQAAAFAQASPYHLKTSADLHRTCKAAWIVA